MHDVPNPCSSRKFSDNLKTIYQYWIIQTMLNLSWSQTVKGKQIKFIGIHKRYP